MKKITGALHENQYTFLIISRSVLFRMRNVSDKSCKKKVKTHISRPVSCFQENRAVYEIMWKILYSRTDHMAPAHCMLILETTNTLRICKLYCLSTATVVSRMPQCYVICTPTVFSHTILASVWETRRRSRGSIYGREKSLYSSSKYPQWLCSPSNLLYYGYLGLSLVVKRPWA